MITKRSIGAAIAALTLASLAGTQARPTAYIQPPAEGLVPPAGYTCQAGVAGVVPSVFWDNTNGSWGWYWSCRTQAGTIGVFRRDYETGIVRLVVTSTRAYGGFLYGDGAGGIYVGTQNAAGIVFPEKVK